MIDISKFEELLVNSALQSSAETILLINGNEQFVKRVATLG